MTQDSAVAEGFVRHVFGPADPSVSLLEYGRFPSGWVEEYRRLLKSLTESVASAPMWPRPMVSALHYALTHLRTRYCAWQKLDSDRRNDQTELDLSRVEAPTLLSAISITRPNECNDPIANEAMNPC